jgi:hypothetical protein
MGSQESKMSTDLDINNSEKLITTKYTNENLTNKIQDNKIQDNKIQDNKIQDNKIQDNEEKSKMCNELYINNLAKFLTIKRYNDIDINKPQLNENISLGEKGFPKENISENISEMFEAGLQREMCFNYIEDDIDFLFPICNIFKEEYEKCNKRK